MNEKYRQLRHFVLLTTIPMVMVAGLIFGYAVGYFFDRWLSTNPWGMVVFSLLGIISGARETVRLIRRVERAQQSEPPLSAEEPPSASGHRSGGL